LHENKLNGLCIFSAPSTGRRLLGAAAATATTRYDRQHNGNSDWDRNGKEIRLVFCGFV